MSWKETGMTKRPQFTKDFEHDVVRLAKTSGQPRDKVAEGRSIGLSTLTR